MHGYGIYRKDGEEYVGEWREGERFRFIDEKDCLLEEMEMPELPF